MNHKKTAINFLASIISFGITGLINFFLSPYLVSTVGESAYGFVSLATTFTSYAAIFSVAINSMSGRFVMIAMERNDLKRANTYYVSTLFADLILGISFLIVGIWVVVNLEKLLVIPLEIKTDVKILFTLVFSGFILTTACSVFDICYFVTNHLYVSSIRTICTAGFKGLLVLILFLSFQPKLYYIGIGTFFVAVITVIFNRVASAKLLDFVRFDNKYFNIKAIRDIVSAGIWNSINSLGTILSEGLDLIICNLFISPEMMGVMSLSKTVPMMLKSISSTITGIFGPETVQKYAAQDYIGMRNYIDFSNKCMRVVMCVPFGIFLGLGRYFYGLWVPEVDGDLLYVLGFLSIAATIFATSVSPVYNIFTAANKLKIPSIVHISGGAISTILVLILLRTTNLGVYAVAGVSSFVGIMKTFAVILPFSAHLIHEKITYFFKESFLAAFTTVAVGLPGFLIMPLVKTQSWLIFILCGIFYTLCAYSIVIPISLSRAERANIINMLKKRGKRNV